MRVSVRIETPRGTFYTKAAECTKEEVAEYKTELLDLITSERLAYVSMIIETGHADSAATETLVMLPDLVRQSAFILQTSE